MTTSNRDSIVRPKDKDSTKKDIWSGMLDGVSSGKKLPEKTAFVLGTHINPHQTIHN